MTACNGYLCIDAGGTFFKYAMLDFSGTPLTEVRQKPANSDGSKQDIIKAYATIFDEVKSEYNISGVGISTPGPFDYVKRMSLMEHKFKSLYKVELGKELEDLLPCGVPVKFMSDGNAFLYGAYDGDESVIGITIGTGLGIAVCRDGRLVTNEIGGPAEVIYNRIVDGRIAEDYVSDRGITEIYKELGGVMVENAKEVSDLAYSGDEKAVQAFSKAGEVLGRVLCDITEKYETKKIFFGGQVSKSFELLRASVSKELGDNIKLIPVTAENPALTGVYKELIAY